MLARQGALLVSAILFASLAAVGGSYGLTEAVDVIVIADRFSSDYGATINVTAHVFDRGELADPSAISAVVNTFPGVAALPLVRTAVGIFAGSFVFDSHPTTVTVNATVDGTQDTGSASVLRAFQPVVRVVPSVGIARPGDAVSVAIEVSDANGPRDASSLELTATVSYAPGFEGQAARTALSWTHEAVGRYSAAFTVPTNIDRDAVIAFWADAQLGDRSGAGVGAVTYVDFPDPLIVWHRTVTTGPSNVTLEIDVASAAGAPLPNAIVSLRTRPFHDFPSMAFIGTTNSSGAVRFDIPWAPEFGLSFDGNVSSGSQIQVFRGDIGPFPTRTPGAPELVRENEVELFAPGETAVLRYRLTTGGTPISNQELFVYGQTRSEVVLAERVSTDQSGRFEVRFVASGAGVILDVGGNIGGMWHAFKEYFRTTNHLWATAANANGWNLTISGRFPDHPGPWIAELRLSIAGGLDVASGPWEAMSGFGAYRLSAGSPGETFGFVVPLPRFVPAGQSIAVSLQAWSLGAEGEGGGLFEFRQTLVTGTPTPGSVDGNALAVLIGLLSVGFLVAVVVFVWQWRRFRPAGPR